MVDRNPAGCRCHPACEMPCWQLVGLVEDPRCGACGCGEMPVKKEAETSEP